MTITMKDGRNELYQWDTGCQVTIDAPVNQFHFAKPGTYGRTIDVDAVESAAAVPDILLQTAGKLSVYAWVDGKTKIEQVFTVKPRKRPADYVYTPADQTKLEKVIEVANSVRQDADAGKFDGGYYKPGIEGDNLTFTGSKPDMPPVEPVPIPGGGGGSGGASKEYVDTAVDGVRKDIPTMTSQLQNDSGYLTEHQSLTDYAKKTEVPTMTSQLTNDAKFVAADKTIQVLEPVTSLEDAETRDLWNIDELPFNTRVLYNFVPQFSGQLSGKFPSGIKQGEFGNVRHIVIDTVGTCFGPGYGAKACQFFYAVDHAGAERNYLYFREFQYTGQPFEWVDLTDKLSQSDLQGGIDTALAQAKESGEFDGFSPTVGVQPTENGHTVTVTDKDGPKQFQVENGKPGNDGKTPALSIGKVDTLAPEAQATAEITGPVENLKLNLGIPQGKPGEGGAGGGGKKIVVQETVLASGTIPDGQSKIDTGVTIGELRKWEVFAVRLYAVQGNTYMGFTVGGSYRTYLNGDGHAALLKWLDSDHRYLIPTSISNRNAIADINHSVVTDGSMTDFSPSAGQGFCKVGGPFNDDSSTLGFLMGAPAKNGKVRWDVRGIAK